MRRFLATLLLSLMLAPPAAYADDEARRKVHVIQQSPFLRALRAEVAPLFGYTLNDSLFQYIQAAATLRFHITEQWSVGGTYGHYFAEESATFNQVQDDFALFPEKAPIKWFAGGEVAWVPIYGKFILFNAGIVHWDAFLTLGGGVTQTGQTNLRVTGTFGVGTRIYMTRWLTLNLELKDHVYREEFKAGEELMNNFVLHAGLGFFIPFGWDYTYPK